MTCNTEIKVDNYPLGTIIIGGPEGQTAFHKKDNGKWYGTMTGRAFNAPDSWEFITKYAYKVVAMGDKPYLPEEPSQHTVVRTTAGYIYQRKLGDWYTPGSTEKFTWEDLVGYGAKVIPTQ